ncbi:MAG TPA: hypothetical protein VFS05_12080 [Gemmatimonadaceae bacterium]|nr:hypothetical protein [Gemmatimonadaceae bacterium]
MREEHITVARTARYYTLGDAAAARELWVVCHGYGQLAARFLSAFAPLDDGTRLIAAPEALSRYYIDATRAPDGSFVSAADRRVGATWMTREDREHEIADQVGYLDALLERLLAPLDRTTVRVVVLGFSQGVATVCRWVERGRARVDDLVLWGGAVPGDVDAASLHRRLGDSPVTLVAGTRDELVSGAVVAEQEMRLRDAGIGVRTVLYDGGHEIVAEELRLVASLAYPTSETGAREA